VRTSLESLPPRVEVHGGKFGGVYVGHVNVERLRLVTHSNAHTSKTTAFTTRSQRIAHLWPPSLKAAASVQPRADLVNVRAAVCRHVDDGLLRDLPYGLVKRADVRGDLFNLRDRSVLDDDLVFELGRPQTQLDQVLQQVTRHAHELAGHRATHVNVGRVRLEALSTSAGHSHTHNGVSAHTLLVHARVR
jgi:hypothetical protein